MSLFQLGVSRVFNAKVADLGDMLTHDDPELHVSGMVHKAFIDVNEAGTEACGVTRVRLRGGDPSPPKPFRADHPFFYAIIANGKCGLPLFCGSLRSPPEITTK